MKINPKSSYVRNFISGMRTSSDKNYKERISGMDTYLLVL
jgi:hypothetical protein